MASIVVVGESPGEPTSVVDYFIKDGSVKFFKHHGKILFNEHDGTVVEGWRKELVQFVKEQGLDVDRDGHGLHAFVYKMIAEGSI